MDHRALRAELLNDPAGLGYAPLIASGSDALLAARLNDPLSGYTVSRGVVPAYAVTSAIPASEFSLLPPANREYLSMLVSAGEVNLDGQTRTDVKNLFGTNTQARANLTALADRLGSRGEQLGFGLITDTDIAVALRGVA